MAGPLLFVYGTLREAPLRRRVLRGAPSRAIGNGSVAGALYDLGEYPGLVEAAAGERVSGTVIELADEAALARLDAYEDVGSGLYVRRRQPVQLDGGGEVEAWVYLYNRPIAGRRRIAAWPA